MRDFNENHNNTIECYLCGKNHKLADCDKKKLFEAQNEDNASECSFINCVMVSPESIEDSNELNENTFLADSATTSHMSHSKVGLFDTYKCTDMIQVGNEKLDESRMRGKKKILVKEDG